MNEEIHPRDDRGLDMEQPQHDVSSGEPAGAHDLVWYVLGLVEVLFLSRFLLHAVGAEPTRWIPSHVDAWTEPLIRPFLDVFPAARAPGTATVEWASLLAILIYPVVAAGIVALFRPRVSILPSETTHKVVAEQ